MNRSPDVDLVLRDYFADDDFIAPDAVLHVVEERIVRQSQRRVWRVPWRDSTVNSYIKPLAVAAFVVIAVVGVAVFGRPSDVGVGGPSATPSPSPSTAVAPSASGTPPWDDQARCGETVPCGGPLTAGTYNSSGVQPRVTYTLTTPWVNVRDLRFFFLLYPDTPDNRALAAAGSSTPYILILPDPAMVVWDEGCPDDAASDALAVDAAGLVEHLASWDGLSVTEPESVTLSGLSGQQIDFSVEPGWTGCLPGHAGGRPPAGTPFRLLVLDKPDGGTLTITLSAPTDFDSFLAEAMPIVESFQFELEPQASPS